MMPDEGNIRRSAPSVTTGPERVEDTERIVVAVAGPARVWPHLVAVAGPDAGRVFRISAQEAVIGRMMEADLRLEARSVSKRHAIVRVVGERVTIEDLGSSNGTFVGLRKLMCGPCEIRDGDEVTLGEAVLVMLRYSVALEGLLRRATYEVASRDPWTGAPNTPHFIDRLRIEHAFSRRHRVPLVIVFLRVDGVTDLPSPGAIDAMMSRTVAVMRETIRAEDVVSRVSQDELVVLFRGSADEAQAMAERARASVAQGRIQVPGAIAPATIAAALVPLLPSGTVAPETILTAACEEARRAIRTKVDCVIRLRRLAVGEI